MRSTVLTLLFSLLAYTSFATQDCIWTSRCAGITVIWVNECDFNNQYWLDSVVMQMAARLDRRDTTTEILILVGHHRVHRYVHDQRFASIAYDTLRPLDDDFIFDNYWKTTGNYTRLLKDADILDYNATNKMGNTKVGLKIMYDMDYRRGKANWNDVEKLLLYATTNEAEIKQRQRSMVFEFFSNGWRLRLTTISPQLIDSLLDWERRPPEPKIMTPGYRVVSFHNITFRVPNFIIEDTVGGFAYSKRFYFEDDNGWIWFLVDRIDKDTLDTRLKKLSLEDYTRDRRDDELLTFPGRKDCMLSERSLYAESIAVFVADCTCASDYRGWQRYEVYGSVSLTDSYYNFEFSTPVLLKDKYKPVFEEILRSVQRR